MTVFHRQFTLNMEVTGSSETLVTTYNTVMRHNLEDDDPNSHRLVTIDIISVFVNKPVRWSRKILAGVKNKKNVSCCFQGRVKAAGACLNNSWDARQSLARDDRG